MGCGLWVVGKEQGVGESKSSGTSGSESPTSMIQRETKLSGGGSSTRDRRRRHSIDTPPTP